MKSQNDEILLRRVMEKIFMFFLQYSCTKIDKLAYDRAYPKRIVAVTTPLQVAPAEL